MNREFEIGDMVICKVSGVIGRVIEFYIPTSCDEQTMVITGDGRKYHASTKDWVKVKLGIDMASGSDHLCVILNPYGKYLVEFAENHGMKIQDAMNDIERSVWERIANANTHKDVSWIVWNMADEITTKFYKMAK